MIWFFLGFLFGVFVAQESPTFPKIKANTMSIISFFKDIVIDEKHVNRRRTKSE